MQELVDRAIIRQHGNVRPLAVYTRQFPMPCHREDFFVSAFFRLLLGLLTAMLAYRASAPACALVSERDRGLVRLMRAQGMRGGVHECAWLLSSGASLFALLAVIMSLLRFGGILPHR